MGERSCCAGWKARDEKATVPVKPEPGVTVTVYPALLPATTGTEAGVADTESPNRNRLAWVGLVSPPLSVTLNVAV